MKITVGGLTYEAPDDTKVGDVVELPDTGYVGHTWTATVTEAPAINPYRGYCKSILRNMGTPLEAAKRRVTTLQHELKEARAEVKRLEGS